MKNLFGKGISQALESSRRRRSTAKGYMSEQGITLVQNALKDRIDRQLLAIASNTTADTRQEPGPLFSTYLSKPLGEGPLHSGAQDFPPSVSTAKPRATFEPWRSPAFAPDGSRYLQVATSCPRVSTSQPSKWGSVSGRLRASDSGCSSRVEYLGRFRGKRVLSFSITPGTLYDTDYQQRHERGLWLGFLRMLSALSLEEACVRAHRALQSHPQVPWSVASVVKPSRSKRAKSTKSTAISTKSLRKTSRVGGNKLGTIRRARKPSKPS